MWVPPLRQEVRAQLDRTRNPFFDHGDAEYFLAWRNGTVVGRIAAIVNRLHNEVHQDRVGFFGFFDSIRDQEVAAALLDTAGAWVRDRGFDTLRGPASFSTNDECGVLVDGFDTPNTVMMAHNPPWYPAMLEEAGFFKAMDLLAYRGGAMAGYVPVPERLVRATEILRQRLGITIRALRMDTFRAEVDLIKALYNRCWERNWGFVPMTDREIEHLASQFKPVVIPQLCPIVMRGEETIGFGLALPDLNEVLRTNRSGRLFPAALRLLVALRRRRFTRARILLLGVLPEYRGKGIDAMLYHHIWTVAATFGMTWGEAGWVLENNPAINLGLQKMTFKVYKTYRMYDRRL
jgi:GNAT superfamily N-acetyltransferase